MYTRKRTHLSLDQLILLPLRSIPSSSPHTDLMSGCSLSLSLTLFVTRSTWLCFALQFLTRRKTITPTRKPRKIGGEKRAQIPDRNIRLLQGEGAGSDRDQWKILRATSGQGPQPRTHQSRSWQTRRWPGKSYSRLDGRTGRSQAGSGSPSWMHQSRRLDALGPVQEPYEGRAAVLGPGDSVHRRLGRSLGRVPEPETEGAGGRRCRLCCSRLGCARCGCHRRDGGADGACWRWGSWSWPWHRGTLWQLRRTREPPPRRCRRSQARHGSSSPGHESRPRTGPTASFSLPCTGSPCRWDGSGRQLRACLSGPFSGDGSCGSSCELTVHDYG